MTVVFIMIAIMALYAATSFYVRKATEYLAASDAPWDRLYHAAETVISDPDMPQEWANFSAAAVMCAGCGCLTQRILWDAAKAKFTRKKRRNGGEPQLTDKQREQVASVVVNAIYYDSLRAPFSGFLLRRLVFPWLRAASQGKAPAKNSNVSSMVKSSKAAIRDKAEGKKLLMAG